MRSLSSLALELPNLEIPYEVLFIPSIKYRYSFTYLCIMLCPANPYRDDGQQEIDPAAVRQGMRSPVSWWDLQRGEEKGQESLLNARQMHESTDWGPVIATQG